MDLVFVVPRQISLRVDEWGRRDLLEDTRSDTRFTVTNLAFAQLADIEFPDSPLYRIYAELNMVDGRARTDCRRIEYEIRTFCNLFAVQLKSAVAVVSALMGDPGHRDEAMSGARNIIRDARGALEVFRGLRECFVDPRIPESTRTTHLLADEYVGDQFARRLIGLAAFLSGHGADEKLLATIDKSAKRELQYEADRGYTAVRSDTIDPADDRALEGLVYRESWLKKWVQSVLYLNVAETGTTRRIGHIVASVAAAVAMSVAVVAAFVADRMYASYSVPWALLIVGSYILKDRIKEVLRGALVRFLPMAVSDRTRVFKDPANGRSVGRVRVAIRTVRLADLAFVRPETGPDAPLVRLEPHVAIAFSTRARLHGRTLLRNHRRVDGVVDITRIRIDKWLRDLDGARKNVRLFVDRNPIEVDAPRVYRVYVSVQLSRTGMPSEDAGCWSIVLSRDGIERIERDADRAIRFLQPWTA